MNPPATQFHLQRNPAGNLTYTDAAGAVHDNVLPLRLFPLTDPGHWVAITSAAIFWSAVASVHTEAYKCPSW